jgi:hypothetical protein
VLLYSWRIAHASTLAIQSILRSFHLVVSGRSARTKVRFLGGLKTTGAITACYAGTLFSSIAVYRRYFYRLRNFPGPRLAGLTKFWHVFHCRDSKNHVLLDRLYHEYGPYIRTGPEELTVIHPEMPLAVDGPGNKCSKAVWYDLLLPLIGLNTTRSKPDHDKRRKIWDREFTTKALATYETRVIEHAEVLERKIAILVSENKLVNVSTWFYWFSFDVMGEFVFARSLGMLEDEKWHIAVVMLRKAMRLVGPTSPVPWLAQIGFNIVPWLYMVRDWLAMLAWCKDRMTERIAVTRQILCH